MANVVIDDTNLTAIGEALRSKLGATREETIYTTNSLPKAYKTSGATGHDNLGSSYSNLTEGYKSFTINGAASVKIKVSLDRYSNSSDIILNYAQGVHTSSSTGSWKTIGAYDIGNIYTHEYTVTGESISLRYKGRVKFYINVYGLDADGNEMASYQVPSIETVSNTFKPREMAPAIANIGTDLRIIPIKGNDVSAEHNTALGVYEFDVSPYVKEGDSFILFYLMCKTNAIGTFTNATLGVFCPGVTDATYTTSVYQNSNRNITANGIMYFFNDNDSSKTNDSISRVDSSYQSTFTWENLKFRPITSTAQEAILICVGKED